MRLTEPIVFVRLAFSLPGQTRQIDNEAIAEAAGTARSRTKALVKLYTSDAFTAIRASHIRAKRRLMDLAIQVPSLFSGSLVLPRRMLDRVEVILQEAQAETQQLVDAFIADGYQAEIARAKKELGPAFEAGDFPAPNVVAREFGFTWRYFSFDVPEDLPKAIRDREEKKLREEINQVAADCRNALREGLVAMVEHLVDRLRPDADGRRKRLHETTVGKLREFLDTLASRDITGDEAIRNLGDKAKALLGAVDVETLRTNSKVADRIQNGLAEVGKEVVALIKTEGGRRFNLDEEE